MKRALLKWNYQTTDSYELGIQESYRTGQRKQAIEMFNDMPKRNRIDFLKNMIYYWGYPASAHIMFFNAIFSL